MAFFVAAHLGAATRAVALDQKDFVVRQVAAFAIGQLAGQHRHARAFALFHFLASLLAQLRGADDQLGEFFAELHMRVEPQVQRGFDKARHQTHCVARIESLFDLPLKLRVQHLGAQNEAGTGKHVFGQQLHALGQQGVQVDEAFHRVEQAIAQTALVGATRAGGNQVDIAFANGRAVFGEGQAPRRALAFGKSFVAFVGKALALEQGDEGVVAQGLRQIVAQAPFVKPSLAVFGFFLRQGDAHARHQHRFAAQEVNQLLQRQVGRLEILGIRPDPHHRALAALACFGFAEFQFFHHITTRKHKVCHLAFAVRGDFHALGQGIGHAHTHTMQAA